MMTHTTRCQGWGCWESTKAVISTPPRVPMTRCTPRCSRARELGPAMAAAAATIAQ